MPALAPYAGHDNGPNRRPSHPSHPRPTLRYVQLRTRLIG
jgi:hypothetical protein